MFHKIRSIVLVCCVVLGMAATNSWATATSKDEVTKEQSTRSIKKEEVVTKVNINTVDLETLQKIKHMSKKKASSVIEYRNKHGAFKSLDELLNVNCRGIHREWLAKVSKYLTL